MSDIKKCDRCGKAYEFDSSGKPVDTRKRYIVGIVLEAKDLWNREYHKTYDLCADCCASLMEWINPTPEQKKIL